jgi:hypothetical protein
MSNYHDILDNITTLTDSLGNEKRAKFNLKTWEKIMYDLFLCIIKAEKTVKL